jgi:hypothetical protein
MPVPVQEDVKAILANFEQRIRRVVEEAWEEWLALPDRGRFVFTPRVRAVLVFDFIARRALKEFDGDPNIYVLTRKQTVHFLFKDQVLVRFKKGNSKGVGSNIVTQEVLDFVDPQRTIPGLVPEIMKIEVCYRPNNIGISLEEVAVVARNRHKRIWAYPIDREEPGAEIIPMPPRMPDATPPIVLPRAPKPIEKSDREE